MPATSYADLPIYKDRKRTYEEAEVMPRVRAWASSDGSGDKDKIDWDKYRKAFMWYDSSKPHELGSYRLKFADVIDGKLYAIWRGVTVLAGVMQGARGGTTIPAKDRGAVKSQIKKYYAKAAKTFDDDSIKVPWSSRSRRSSVDAPSSFSREQGPGGLEARIVPAELRDTVARAAGDDSGPVIEGYGSVAEQPTTIGGMYSEWTEEVAAGAWVKSIAEGDIRSMFNHDTNLLLGRTKAGTLRLDEDDNGLRYEININPDDPMAMGVHARVARGDVDGSSVWFRVIRQEWTYPDDSNDLEMPHRRILEGQLMETGPVTFPAFEQTTSSARALGPVDAVLRAAGISSSARRARLASDLIADPEGLEEELRQLLASAPELRAAVCTCSARAADDAPEGAAPPTPASTVSLTVARARLELARLAAV